VNPLRIAENRVRGEPSGSRISCPSDFGSAATIVK